MTGEQVVADAPVPEDLETARRSNPHLVRYLQDWQDRGRDAPSFMVNLPRDLKYQDRVNVLHPVGDPIFVHLHGRPGRKVAYRAVEPQLPEDLQDLYDDVRDEILSLAVFEDPPEDIGQLRATLDGIFERIVREGPERSLTESGGLLEGAGRRVVLPPEERELMHYYLHRNIVDHGPLEPLIRDPHLEDIHGIGLEPIRLIHKIFGYVETNIRFRHERALDEFLRTMSERVGRPVSDTRPIVDATLPDGSRLNIVYPPDVSLNGSSFTIRKFPDTPLSITQICHWGTLSPHLAAYLWLCLEYGQSVFICGEVASGKSTTLNAILPFVRPKLKIYSAEDTPEMRPPQPTWQQLVTREQGPEESQVDMFDLLKAALRSRPDYIVVGEIRGAEGNVAFQAMQTGHPVLSTFHASSATKMIQRLSSPPIEIPETFIDNLNVAVIQMSVYHQGKMLRRVISVEEIEGYSDYADGVITRAVFKRDAVDDEHVFRGRNNSFVLEERIAKVAGYEDTRRIYKELDKRALIIEKMIEERIFHYDDVKEVIWAYYRDGVEGLPFTL